MLIGWLDCPCQEYVHRPYGVIDVLTDDAIYVVKAELSTPNAHSAIGQLLTYRLARPNRRLVIARLRVTARIWMMAISDLEIEIAAIDTTLPTKEKIALESSSNIPGLPPRNASGPP